MNIRPQVASWMGPVVTLAIALAVAVAGYGALQAKTEQVQSDVSNIEKTVLRLEERKADTRQVEETSARLSRIEEKIDRLVERVGMRR